MTDLFKSKEREFYIELKQERYYFPGEDISGDVILDMTKATKTNNIKVLLEGIVEIGGRTITLFSKYVLIAQSPDGEKSYYLEPHTHRFPFIITIPTSKECKVPSTLEIAKLLKVNYRLTAIFNKPFTVLEKLSASTTTSINILEDINVESTEYCGDYKVEKELYLTGETSRPVTVSTVIGKRAAVKGDTIPITVKIEHIGVMVRDKAISVQLLRSVYYGRNRTELFGPKILKEVTSNIEISGPVNFTKSFILQLAIPPNLCPTVEKSGQTFRIEYTLRISVNLNEENPHRAEVPQDIVLFNVPFIIGTYPKLSFNIDDDDDEEEEEIKGIQRDEVASNHSSEYDQVAEKMKEMDLSLEAVPPQMIQKPPTPPPKNTYSPLTPLPALSCSSSTSSSKPTTYIAAPPMMVATSEKKDSITKKPEIPSSPFTEKFAPQIPMMISPKPTSTTEAVPPMLSSSSSPSVKPLERIESNLAIPPMIRPVVKPLDRLPSNGAMTSPFPTPKMESVSSGGVSSPTKIPSPPTQEQPINNNSSVSHSQSNFSEQRINHSSLYIRPSEIYNDYKPILSPTSSIHRHDSVASTTSTTGGLGRQESVHWIVRNQDAPTPAPAVTSPVISANNNYPSVASPPPLPPRPNNSSSNQQAGFALPQPDIHASSPLPPPFSNNNNYYQPQQQYPPQQHYDSFSNGGMMPVPQPAPVPHYTYNNGYGYPPPEPQQQNNYNNHPLYNSNVSFPVPQHPHNYGGNLGMGGMPSHQNYHQSHQHQQQQQYPSYYNS